MPNYNSTLQTNNTDLQAILDMVNALPEAGESGGSSENEDMLITKDFGNSYTNNRVTKIAMGVFSHTGLTTVDFPCVTYIGSSAFTECYKLNDINFPSATSIGSNAFASCGNLY